MKGKKDRDTINWTEVFMGRKEATRNLPNILKLPTVRGRMDILTRRVKDNDLVLDMGAHDRTTGKLIEKAGIKAKYFSLDVDRTHKHDYYSMDEIDRRFDVVMAFEFVEHITPTEIVEFFKKAASILKENGLIVISTPNVCHPVYLWRDCTHITPVRHDELYGLLHSTGFSDIEIFRSGKFKWKQRFWAFVFRPLIKLLRMDYYPSIIATARRGVARTRGREGAGAQLR